jgi:hypothetical protein
MIFTARQLEELHRTNGHITLPYRARLTPLAQDWLKKRKIEIGYAEVEVKAPTPTEMAQQQAVATASNSKPFAWWCDGPCGPAKAALIAQSKESSLAQSQISEDPKKIVMVVRGIADDLKNDRIAGAILLVKTGAEALVYANRCQSIRAINGTCIDAVEQGLREIAANALVIEHPYKTLSQVKNLLSRFVRGKRELREDVRQRLKELATCG